MNQPPGGAGFSSLGSERVVEEAESSRPGDLPCAHPSRRSAVVVSRKIASPARAAFVTQRPGCDAELHWLVSRKIQVAPFPFGCAGERELGLAPEPPRSSRAYARTSCNDMPLDSPLPAGRRRGCRYSVPSTRLSSARAGRLHVGREATKGAASQSAPATLRIAEPLSGLSLDKQLRSAAATYRVVADRGPSGACSGAVRGRLPSAGIAAVYTKPLFSYEEHSFVSDAPLTRRLIDTNESAVGAHVQLPRAGRSSSRLSVSISSHWAIQPGRRPSAKRTVK